MILHGPEHLIGNGGRECDSLVELRDVMPTLLNIAGVTPSAPLDGCSMLENGCTREYLHGEHTHGRDSNHFIVTKSDKYVWFSQSGREQYFRLDVDPGNPRTGFLLRRTRKESLISVPCWWWSWRDGKKATVTGKG